MRESEKKFSGIAPKIAPTQLPANMAQVSANTRIYSGEMRPFFAPLPVAQLVKQAGEIQTIYFYKGDTWLCWTQDVNVAQAPHANDSLERLAFTGTDAPRITTKDLWNDVAPGTDLPPASYKLGLPGPSDTPVASDGGAGVLDAAYAWVYTFVRKWSDNTTDESGPSQPTAVLVLENKQANISMPNTAAPTFDDYGITHKRIYRLKSGTTGAQYQFVAEVTAATTDFVDNVPDTSLGDAIESWEYLPPPDGMKGLIMLPNGVACGFMANTIYLSEPYRIHAYPLRNRKSIGPQIVGLGHYKNTVVVGTDSYPYLALVTDPATATFQFVSLRQPCSSKRSFVSTEFGVMYASPDGMTLIGPDGATLATRDLVKKEEWKQFFPETIHGHYHDGAYFGFFRSGTNQDGSAQGGGFYLDRSEGEAGFFTLNYYAYAAHAVPESDNLYVVQRRPVDFDKMWVYQWEGAETTVLPMTRRTRIFVERTLTCPGWLQIAGRYGQGLSAAAQAAINAQNDAIKASNQALLASGDLEDALGLDNICQYPLAMEKLLEDLVPLNFIPGTINVRFYADGVLIYDTVLESSEPIPLPGDYLGTEFEVEFGGSVAVREVAFADTLEELAVV